MATTPAPITATTNKQSNSSTLATNTKPLTATGTSTATNTVGPGGQAPTTVTPKTQPNQMSSVGPKDAIDLTIDKLQNTMLGIDPYQEAILNKQGQQNAAADAARKAQERQIAAQSGLSGTVAAAQSAQTQRDMETARNQGIAQMSQNLMARQDQAASQLPGVQIQKVNLQNQQKNLAEQEFTDIVAYTDFTNPTEIESLRSSWEKAHPGTPMPSFETLKQQQKDARMEKSSKRFYDALAVLDPNVEADKAQLLSMWQEMYPGTSPDFNVMKKESTITNQQIDATNQKVAKDNFDAYVRDNDISDPNSDSYKKAVEMYRAAYGLGPNDPVNLGQLTYAQNKVKKDDAKQAYNEFLTQATPGNEADMAELQRLWGLIPGNEGRTMPSMESAIKGSKQAAYDDYVKSVNWDSPEDVAQLEKLWNDIPGHKDADGNVIVTMPTGQEQKIYAQNKAHESAVEEYQEFLKGADLTKDLATLKELWNKAYPNSEFPSNTILRKEQENATITLGRKKYDDFLAEADFTNASDLAQLDKYWKEAYGEDSTPPSHSEAARQVYQRQFDEALKYADLNSIASNEGIKSLWGKLHPEAVDKDGNVTLPDFTDLKLAQSDAKTKGYKDAYYELLKNTSLSTSTDAETIKSLQEAYKLAFPGSAAPNFQTMVNEQKTVDESNAKAKYDDYLSRVGAKLTETDKMELQRLWNLIPSNKKDDGTFVAMPDETMLQANKATVLSAAAQARLDNLFPTLDLTQTEDQETYKKAWLEANPTMTDDDFPGFEKLIADQSIKYHDKYLDDLKTGTAGLDFSKSEDRTKAIDLYNKAYPDSKLDANATKDQIESKMSDLFRDQYKGELDAFLSTYTPDGGAQDTEYERLWKKVYGPTSTPPKNELLASQVTTAKYNSAKQKFDDMVDMIDESKLEDKNSTDYQNLFNAYKEMYPNATELPSMSELIYQRSENKKETYISDYEYQLSTYDPTKKYKQDELDEATGLPRVLVDTFNKAYPGREISADFVKNEALRVVAEKARVKYDDYIATQDMTSKTVQETAREMHKKAFPDLYINEDGTPKDYSPSFDVLINSQWGAKEKLAYSDVEKLILPHFGPEAGKNLKDMISGNIFSANVTQEDVDLMTKWYESYSKGKPAWENGKLTQDAQTFFKREFGNLTRTSGEAAYNTKKFELDDLLAQGTIDKTFYDSAVKKLDELRLNGIVGTDFEVTKDANGNTVIKDSETGEILSDDNGVWEKYDVTIGGSSISGTINEGADGTTFKTDAGVSYRLKDGKLETSSDGETWSTYSKDDASSIIEALGGYNTRTEIYGEATQDESGLTSYSGNSDFYSYNGQDYMKASDGNIYEVGETIDPDDHYDPDLFDSVGDPKEGQVLEGAYESDTFIYSGGEWHYMSEPDYGSSGYTAIADKSGVTFPSKDIGGGVYLDKQTGEYKDKNGSAADFKNSSVVTSVLKNLDPNNIESTNNTIKKISESSGRSEASIRADMFKDGNKPGTDLNFAISDFYAGSVIGPLFSGNLDSYKGTSQEFSDKLSSNIGKYIKINGKDYYYTGGESQSEGVVSHMFVDSEGNTKYIHYDGNTMWS